MRMSMYRTRTSMQLGFSLIEAMVALVVVSVGMIGIAGLYGQGLSAGRTALYRTQAVNLAADMADRIRVNRLGGAKRDPHGYVKAVTRFTGAAPLRTDTVSQVSETFS